MAEPKNFASLSSGLLARKGAAKPAMRPQGFGTGFNMGHEDLGWNDMGYDQPQAEFEPLPDHVPSSITALTPAPKLQVDVHPLEGGVEADEVEEAEELPAYAITPVEQQRAEIAARLAQAEESLEQGDAEESSETAPAQPSTAAIVPISSRRAPGAKGKAAFTLRLDPDRHLRLRLVCAITHRSAQQIVTEALDNYLESHPEFGSLADKLPAQARGRN